MQDRLIIVETPEQARAFIEMAPPLYAGDPSYVRPMDADLQEVFDPAKNKHYHHGEPRRWLLYRGEQCIGRIAAFSNKRNLPSANAPGPVYAGGLGFFECTDDQAAANQLLAVAEEWVASKGHNAVDGPINFGERERWWGCLVEGFTKPNYCCAYNPPYYQRLLEEAGYQVHFGQLTFYRPLKKPMHPIVMAKGERIIKDPAYHFEYVDMRRLDTYIEHFTHIYNLGWAKHQGVQPMSLEESRALVYSLKPILDPRLLWFAYHNGEPIAFFATTPDVNELIYDFDGRLGWYQKLKLAYRLRYRDKTKMVGQAFGVVPAFQGKGVESAIVVASGDKLQRTDGFVPYRDVEFNWVGDFNPKMIKLCLLMGAEVIKRHHTYRKIFDPAIPFQRMEEIK